MIAALLSFIQTFQDDIKSKKNEIQTLDDANTDVLMMEDDEEKVL